MDLLEADKKFLLFAHHQEILDAVEEAVKSAVMYISYWSLTSVYLCSVVILQIFTGLCTTARYNEEGVTWHLIMLGILL
jgi:hypothetical protein